MEDLQGFLGGLHFASPFLALGGLIVFLIFCFLFLRREKTEKHSHLEQVSDKGQTDKIWQKLFFVLPFLIFASVLLALASLQIVQKIEKPIEARDIQIVIDASGSMVSFSFYRNEPLPRFTETRLGVAWQFVTEFIKMRQGDRMAIILYDSPRGYIARGFTDDQEQLLTVFDEKEIMGIYDYNKKYPENDSLDGSLDRYVINRGTNTPAALLLAEDYLGREAKSKTKLIILVTDLDDDPYGVPDALAKARARGFRVYTIAIIDSQFGGRQSEERLNRLKGYFKDEGLRFFAVQNRDDWTLAINSIDQMEKSVVGTETVTVLKQVSWAFIVSAIFFAVLFMILSEKFKKVP